MARDSFVVVIYGGNGVRVMALCGQPGKQFDSNTKNTAIDRVLNKGMTVKQVAERMSISPSTIRNWLREHEQKSKK